MQHYIDSLKLQIKMEMEESKKTVYIKKFFEKYLDITPVNNECENQRFHKQKRPAYLVSIYGTTLTQILCEECIMEIQ